MTAAARMLLALFVTTLVPVAVVRGQVLRATTMTATDFAKLSRGNTAIILPGGPESKHWKAGGMSLR